MASVKETFNCMISKAIENAELIETPKDKAVAYAAIASALAQTGRVSDIIAESVTEPVVQKNADKMKKQPGFLPPDKEEILGEPVEETEKKISEMKKVTPKFTAEWTDEANAYYEKEFAYLEKFLEKWGEDGFNQCLADFSSGTIKDFDGINPLNISALVTYLKEIEAQEEKSA